MATRTQKSRAKTKPNKETMGNQGIERREIGREDQGATERKARGARTQGRRAAKR